MSKRLLAVLVILLLFCTWSIGAGATENEARLISADCDLRWNGSPLHGTLTDNYGYSRHRLEPGELHIAAEEERNREFFN